jgi:HK97 family phage major capsid protein
MSKSAKELGLEYVAKVSATKEFLESKKGADGQLRMTTEEIERVRTEHAEISDIKAQHTAAMETEGILEKLHAERQEMNRVANPDIAPSTADATPVRKSIVQTLRENADLKNAYDRMTVTSVPGYYQKATMTAAANGFPPESVRSGIIVMSVQYPPTIEDIIPSFDTDQASIVFMQETVHTNGVTETAEGVALGESTLTFASATAGIGLLGSILPITEQQIRDVPQLAAIVENRLILMNRKKRNNAFINANTSGGIVGFLNASGLGSQPMGTDNAIDCIMKGITQVEVTGGGVASDVVMHPNDWRDYRLMRTVDGIYIWGSPSGPEAGKAEIWGLPVTKTTDISAGTALVGDFKQYSAIANNTDLTVEIGRNGTDFAEVQHTARVISRAGLVVYRGAAFVACTGLSF